MKKHVRSRAPMRLSFGGGGTEIPPFVNQFGGSTLSTTIAVYARASIEINKMNSIELSSLDRGIHQRFSLSDFKNPKFSEIDSDLRLLFACVWYVIEKTEAKFTPGITLKTSSDAPQGSGLGASSVLTVSILRALDEFFEFHWSKTELAEIAFYIERETLKLSGGKQDHYAAAFGGCNFIDYHANGNVSVEPIDLNEYFKRDLESSLISIYTGTSRESAHIIEDQQSAMTDRDQITIDSLIRMKDIAIEMRRSIRKEDIKALGSQLHDSWILKKSTSALITNQSIDSLYARARELGAYGGKIAGAGGGGYLVLLASPENRSQIISNLVKDDMVVLPVVLTSVGAEAWEVKS